MTHGRVWLQRGLTVALVLVAAALLLVFPPGVLAAGIEKTYASQTTDVATTATTEGTAAVVVNSGAASFGASECAMISAYVPFVTNTAATGSAIWVLYNVTNGAVAARWGQSRADASTTGYGPHAMSFRVCAINGSREYSLRLYTTVAGTVTAKCGMGGTTNYAPCFISIVSLSAPDEAPEHVIVDSGNLTADVGNQPTVKLSQTSTDNAVDINGQPIGIDCVSGCDASSLSGSNGDYLQLSAWGVWFSGGLLLILILAPYFGRAFRFWETA